MQGRQKEQKRPQPFQVELLCDLFAVLLPSLSSFSLSLWSEAEKMSPMTTPDVQQSYLLWSTLSRSCQNWVVFYSWELCWAELKYCCFLCLWVVFLFIQLNMMTDQSYVYTHIFLTIAWGCCVHFRLWLDSLRSFSANCPLLPCCGSV